MRLVMHADAPDRKFDRMQKCAVRTWYPARINVSRIAVARETELLAVEYSGTRCWRDAQHHRRRLYDIEPQVAADVRAADSQLSLVTSTVTARWLADLPW